MREHDPAVREFHDTCVERRLEWLKLTAESTRKDSLSRPRQGSCHLQRFQRSSRKRCDPLSDKLLKLAGKLGPRVEAIAAPLQGARELQGVERVAGRQLV
jgi:hypothetical protein